MSERKKPFFVGYLGVPKGLKGFLLKVSVLLIASFAAGGLLAGVAQDDPGAAGFRFDYGRQDITGIITAKPYPLLYVTKGSKRVETGTTIMLTGQGKRGVMSNPEEADGMVVDASGIIVERGELQMMQLRGGNNGLKETGNRASVPETVSLGTWRLQGEICDGKCLAGAMQPGRGIAHKACANLCLIGDIPPVFVSSQPVEGEEYLLVGDINGGPLSPEAYHFVGDFVELDVEIEKRGDLLVMLVDPAKIRAIP